MTYRRLAQNFSGDKAEPDETKPRKVFFRGCNADVYGIHGARKSDRGQSREDQSHLRSQVPYNSQVGTMVNWPDSSIEPVHILLH